MSNKLDNLINIFLKNPNRDYHIRELARILNKSPTTISKELKELEKTGFLISKFERNHHIYKINVENPEYKILKKISKLMKENKEFLNQVIDGKTLYGFWKVFK